MFQTSSALRRSVHSQVADRVGGSIVRGEIGVGETLPPEMQICEMMDVSRTVVREAMRTLTGKGLIESRPKSGTRVRPPEQWNQLDPDVLRWHLETADIDRYLAKLFQLRTAVEPALRRWRRFMPASDDIARIRAGCDGMDAATTNEDVRRRRHRLPPVDLFRDPQRVLLADRADVRDHPAPELHDRRPRLAPAAALIEHRAQCWTRSRPAMPTRRAGDGGAVDAFGRRSGADSGPGV